MTKNIQNQADIPILDKTSKETILREFAPPELLTLKETQNAIPLLAKNKSLVREIEAVDRKSVV